MLIFLADLQNSHERYVRNSVPIGMGYVAAYLKKLFNDNIEIQLFRKFDEIYEALKEIKPDIAAFGSYCWNTQLTLNTASYIRKRYPDVIIAVGGPDVSSSPDMLLNDLRRNPQVDFYMPNEGEQPTANIVETILNGRNPEATRKTEIKGCFSINPETNRLWGNALSVFEGDINEIPSPYLNGLMDRFLLDADYMPAIQTSRGCPYSCTFCACGNSAKNKIRPFAVERVKAEIDYVQKIAKNSFLRFVDENLGILPRDLEIVEYLIEQKKITGFPQSGSIYTDKHPTERVKKICWLMREIIPFCISFQSTTPRVLESIKRINLTDEEINDAILFARKNALIIVSELIFMLPNETVASFLSSVQKLIDFRFESIEVGPLQILKGSEMDTLEDRKKNGVRTMYSVAEKGYTYHPALENIEVDEWVVANKTISEAEHFKTLRFIYLLDFAHYRSYLKEILFFFECHGVSTTNLLSKIAECPDDYPLLAGSAAKYEQGIREFLFESHEEVKEYVRKKIAHNEELLGFYDLRRKLMIDLLMSDQLPDAVNEIIAAGTQLYKNINGIVPLGFKDEIDLITKLTLSMFIPLHYAVPSEIELESNFDIKNWMSDNYSKPLSNYMLSKPIKLVLKMRGFDFYREIWEKTESNLTKYRMAFRIFTSANRRRYLSVGDN
jgi:radical SAM superfamily enzyme YgiQ (UPF0313 family)